MYPKPERLKRTCRDFLAVLAISILPSVAFSQIAAWDFTGESSPVTSAADVYNANMDASNLLTRGTGATASTASNSFRTAGFQNNGISTANTDYFQFTLSAAAGYTLSVSTIDARFAGTATYAASPGVTHQFAYSTDGSSFTLIGSPVVTVGAATPLPQVDLSGVAALQDVAEGTTVTFRYYASGQTTTGGWGFASSGAGVYGLSIGGSLDLVAVGCGITLGTASTSCNANTIGIDTYDLTIPYTGIDAGTVVVNNGPSGSITGTNPATTPNGAVVISGITEGDAYNVTFTSPCDALGVNGSSPTCEPALVPVYIAAWDLTGETMLATSTAEIYDASMDASNLLTRGAGAAASAGANSFRTAGFQNNGISTANTDHFQTTLSASVGNTLSLASLEARVTGTAGYAASPGVSNQFAYSLDGSSFTLIGSPSVTIGTNQTFTVDLSGVSALQNVAAGVTVTLRYYASGQTNTGGWGFYSNAVGNYGLAVLGTVASAGTCGITLGAALTTCDANTPGTDTYTLSIPYTGLDAGTAVVNNSGSGTVGGDDPALVSDGTITVSGITEGTSYSMTFTNSCNGYVVSGPSPICIPACGVTLGLVNATCNSFTAGPVDTYNLSIAYTGSQVGVTVINNSGSGTIGGDDPAILPNGTILISGIDEADAYSVTFSAPCGALNVAGAAPICEPAPTLTVINFDDATKWTAGAVALTSYATDHTYVESGWSFTGGGALRNGIAAQDGFPGALDLYSWRMQNVATVDWRATYNGTAALTQFGFDVRRWDGSPEPSFNVSYSTDGGANFSSTILTIDNTFLDNSSAWKTYSYSIPSPAQYAPGNLIVRVAANGANERIMIDNFSFDTGAVACALGLGTPSTTCDSYGVGPVDTYTLTINYTGVQAGASVINNSGSGTISGDDPSTVTNGTIIVSGITEGTGYNITFSVPCETLVLTGASPTCEPAPSLVINEVNYDETGTDVDEFVEIMNTGVAPIDLNGMKLVLVNGSTDSPYLTVVLNNVMLAAGDYYVVGNSGVTNLDQVGWPINTMQNGAPDGVRLTTANGSVIDQMSYEGNMSTTEGTSAGTDPGNEIGLSLCRIPNGVDTNDNSLDFVLACSSPGAANTFDDADNDGTVDCIDQCPGGPEPFSACDDGDPNTGDDTVQLDCTCVGIANDCNGVPDGPDLPGMPCDDFDPNTVNDVYQANCACVGETIDCMGMPGGPALPGSPCIDFDPSTFGDVYDAFCTCAGAPCTQDLLLQIDPGTAGSQIGWEITALTDPTVICGVAPGTYLNDPSGSPIVEPCCLAVGCYRLSVFDSAGDGIAGGGYQLREIGANGRRIIDNTGNFPAIFESSISGSEDFCVPISDEELIWSSCDKMDWVNNKYLVAHANADVSAEWIPNGANNVQDANSGYEFWIFDPNGTYSYRRFRSHNVSDGKSPANATRACHMKINGWYNTALTPLIPQNTLLNVRIRARVNGDNGAFGPACRMMLDPARAACPLVKLQDDPANTSDYSCGVIRNFGGTNSSANKLVALPPQFQPAPLAGGTGVRYQFRFRIPGEQFCLVRPPQTSPTLYLNWTNAAALQASKTYEVEVRVSKDQGATWCVDGSSPACDPNTVTAWGKTCSVTISSMNVQGGPSNMQMGGGSSFTLYPNPNNGDQLFLSLTNVAATSKTIAVELFDLTGKRAMIRTIPVNEGMVNVVLPLNGELAKGIYLVQLTEGTSRYTERLVVQ